ncbi:hypothetical protein K1719_030841 [Acacia pycnantha]|nr:hypothetical protein K1719_030841 [Acacia pycnantha]
MERERALGARKSETEDMSAQDIGATSLSKADREGHLSHTDLANLANLSHTLSRSSAREAKPPKRTDFLKDS